MIDAPVFAFLAMAVAVPLLWVGANWVVGSASAMARKLGWSELTIGLTVVAFGTSAPEFVVTLGAAMRGAPGISVGNVIGSNIFNTGVILGCCAAFWFVPVARAVVRRDLPLLFAATAAILWFAFDLTLKRWEGGILIIALAGYLTLLMRTASPNEVELDEQVSSSGRMPEPLRLVLGLTFISAGAHLMVEGATAVAEGLGWPEWLIGVTLVAAGTSLPELFTALAAARRGSLGLLFGNLIGSDLFNLLGVLGLAVFIHPMAVEEEVRVGLIMMLCAVILLWGMVFSGARLSRIEGAVLVAVALARWARDIYRAG